MQTGLEVIEAISKNTGIPVAVLLRIGLGGYAGEGVSQFSNAEQQVIIAMASAAFGEARARYGLDGISPRTSQELREAILTTDAPISPALRGFIRDHCPCP